MLVGQQQRLQDDIRGLVARYGRQRSSLIPVLQEIQKTHTTISDFAMQVVADELGIHPAEVYGVTSFYAFLRQEPRGRFVFRLCQTISCDMRASRASPGSWRTTSGSGSARRPPTGGSASAWANCIGMCDQGPALLVNDRVYTQVTPEKVHEILEECRSAFGAHARAGAQTKGKRR